MTTPSSIFNLVTFALNKGYVISVYDGEVWSLIKSNDRVKIMDEINGVDDAQIRIRDMSKEHPKEQLIGWAQIVNGLAPEELVADHTDNEFFAEWSKHYEEII